MVDEGGAASIDDFEHQFESVGATVVGIRHIQLSVLTRVEVTEEREQGTSIPFGLQLAEVPEVAAIHREDVIELVEILGSHAPRRAAEHNSVPHRNLGGTRVGRLSLVPRPRASRVYPDSIRETLFLQTVRQNPFCEGRPADVAQADEEHRDVVFHGHCLGLSRRGLPLKVLIPGAYP